MTPVVWLCCVESKLSHDGFVAEAGTNDSPSSPMDKAVPAAIAFECRMDGDFTDFSQVSDSKVFAVYIVILTFFKTRCLDGRNSD